MNAEELKSTVYRARLALFNASWSPEKHPRGADGRFGSSPRKVSGAEFRKALQSARDSMPESMRWRVDVHEEAEYDRMGCYVMPGGSTFAVKPNGDIVSVCKNANGGDRGDSIMACAVEHGGNRLDSYEGNHRYYRKCGFEPVSWTKFDPQYAPAGTPAEDVVFYAYTGNKVKFRRDTGEDKAELDDFKGREKAMSYEAASIFRDNFIERQKGQTK